jgi:hypothetical protein
MNYLPYTGYWFYGGADPIETQLSLCSYGLLFDVPGSVPVVSGRRRVGMLMGIYYA